MTSELLTHRLIHTMVNVNYGNTSEWLKQVMKDPLDMEFFQVIQEKLQESGLKVLISSSMETLKKILRIADYKHFYGGWVFKRAMRQIIKKAPEIWN